MPLTIKDVKNAKIGRRSDGNGLYLLVQPKRDADGKPLRVVASKSWVLRVQYRDASGESKRRDFGLGTVVFESVGGDIPIERRKLLTLAEAREKARIGRALAKAGINPSEHWRQDRERAVHTFKEVAGECHRQAKKGWRDGKHGDEWLSSLERLAFPIIGSKPIEEVDATDIERVLLPIWLATPETARRVKQRIGVILDHAHAKGWRPNEAPMRAVNQLMRKIKQPKAGNFAAMAYTDVPAFMAKLRDAELSVGRLALRFLILTAARSGEVRNALWREIDLEAAEWRIPPEKMKAGKIHIIPLVPAAIDILKQMQGLFPARPDDLLFPGLKGRSMSDATMAKVLKLTDGGVGMTVHGFRSSFRDWAADTGFADAWAEAALAHSVASQDGKTAAAYKRTTYFEHRRDKLMPAWASFVLGDKSNVISLAERRA